MKNQYISVKSVRAAIRTANSIGKSWQGLSMWYGLAMATDYPDNHSYNKRRTF